MKQMTLARGGFERYGKTTKRAAFLAEMDQVIPWDELCSVIEPHYPKAGGPGRPPVGLQRMLRIHFLQHWFNLSDPAVEEALYESLSMREFAGIDLGHEPVPDETTICKFRHLLERHELGRQIFERVGAHLQARGFRLSTGTIVDATLIAAPSSTKNARGNGSLWTLIVEERLYIFTALIFFLQHKYKKPYILLIVFYNLLYIWNQKIGQFSSSNLLNGQSAYYALMFLNAGLFYLSGYDFKQKPSVFYILLIGLLLAVSLIFPAMDYFQLIFFPLLVIVFAYLRMPTNKAGKWGDFTYGIYIFSFPVQQMLIAFAKGSLKPLQLFAYTVAICLPLAILSWHILEKKMLKLKDRIK